MKLEFISFQTISIGVLMICLLGCKMPVKDSSKESAPLLGSFEYDADFLKKYYKNTLVLYNKDSKVLVSPELQGRVMTSTMEGDKGQSFGWINYDFITSGKIEEHFNPIGGEERFWLGPEGGQYAIFFKKGSKFTLDNWYTPKLIDLKPFDVKWKTSNKVIFTKTASLTNYSGFTFDLAIEREVKVLSTKEIIDELGLNNADGIKAVAYQTTNTLKNIGTVDWIKETGVLSVWLLGMFSPSPATTIIIPYISGDEADLGVTVNDSYFGKVPSERLVVKENVVYFSGDGEYRSKIGLSPKRAKNILGSYDATNGILTIVNYNKPENISDYVNSMWEIQTEPYAGDVVNSYNDGPPEPDKKPLGPFYELETSSPALVLKAGESGVHIQLTCHIEGTEEQLDPIVKQLFGVSIIEVKNAFE